MDRPTAVTAPCLAPASPTAPTRKNLGIRALWRSEVRSRLMYWAARRHPVKTVQGGVPQAHQRLRYQVYVDEIGYRNHPAADHERGVILDRHDDDPRARCYQIGPDHAPVGTLLITVFERGQVPTDLWECFSLDRLPDARRWRVAVGTKLMVRKSSRGGIGTLALVTEAARDTMRRSGADILILDCAPGLVRMYKNLGLRDFGGRFIRSERGLGVPMVLVNGDLEHLRRVGSPWLHLGRSLAREGALPDADPSRVEARCRGPRGVNVRPESLLEAIEERVRGGDPLLAALPPEARALLTQSSYVLNVPAGERVIWPDSIYRDLFVILSGHAIRATARGAADRLRAGDAFGEGGHLGEEGRPQATVTAGDGSTLCVLALRPRAMREILERFPTAMSLFFQRLALNIAGRGSSTE